MKCKNECNNKEYRNTGLCKEHYLYICRLRRYINLHTEITYMKIAEEEKYKLKKVLKKLENQLGMTTQSY